VAGGRQQAWRGGQRPGRPVEGWGPVAM
jgi:hypothetical protein